MARFQDVGNRLYQIRCIAGFGDDDQQKKFAEKVLRVKAGTYSVWEIGKGGMPVKHALDLVEYMPGLTLDFIYRGDLDFLPPKLGRLFAQAPNRPPTKRGRAKRRAPPARGGRHS
jgi:hypothetical protein